MDIFTPLLVSLCVGTPGNYNGACQKAIEATYIQSGWAAKAKTLQDGTVAYGGRKEKAVLGNKTAAVNTLVLTGVAVKNKKVKLILPNLGICDRLSTEVQPSNYSLKLEWSW